MRCSQDFQGTMFSDISLEEWVPAAHSLRKLRAVVYALVRSIVDTFSVACYTCTTRHVQLPSELLRPKGRSL